MEIQIQHVNKRFAKVHALQDVELDIHDRQFVCLVGESGSGKTTLLKTIAGLLEPDNGSITISKTLLKGINVQAGMVFQNAALLPWLTVRENIIFPFTVHNTPFNPAEVERVIHEVGLHSFEQEYPRNLSGGQRQRVGIARALVVGRPILLLDEPFSALDIKTASELRTDLLQMWSQKNLTVVMVSHLVEEAVELADVIVIFKEGRVHTKVHIDLPRPRNLESQHFLDITDHIKQIIEN